MSAPDYSKDPGVRAFLEAVARANGRIVAAGTLEPAEELPPAVPTCTACGRPLDKAHDLTD